MRVDLLLLNGHIVTMAGPGLGQADALAVTQGRVIAAGTAEQLVALATPRTRVIDLGGRLATPGFADSHVHLTSLARLFSSLRLSSARTASDALRQVAARARRTPPGSWITGAGFDKNRWGDAFPTRHDLDRVAPDHPVALTSRDGHSVWANTRALRLCGITRRTPSPEGGVIVKDARGEPTGILQETAARSIRELAAPSRAAVGGRELRAAVRSLLRQGVTSVHCMEETETLLPLQQLRDDGGLDLRVTLYRTVTKLDALASAGLRSGFGDEWLRIGGIKLLIDGALGSQTAWMFEPYENSDVGCGVPVLHGSELRLLVQRASKAGLACAVHAIGDRANAEALDALAEVAHIRTPLPHRIEHAQLLRPRDLRVFARLGVVASMQPCHIPGDIPTAERYWGKRSRWAYPVRSLSRAGVALAFGSDAPVETANPMVGIYAAVQRQTLDGCPHGSWYKRQEGINVAQALRAYTLGPALATGEARTKGRLTPGSYADVVVWSWDFTRLRGRRLLEPKADLVFVGGRLKYRRRGR